jgi:hypothetical protein
MELGFRRWRGFEIFIFVSVCNILTKRMFEINSVYENFEWKVKRNNGY